MSHETTATSAPAIQQMIGRMTVRELSDSIRAVLESGRLGTPVNVRLHWEISEPASRLSTVSAAAVAIADLALQLDEPTWRVRRHASGKTLNVLGSDRQGRTLMISLVAEATPLTALTIFGNHGLVRLDDGWVDPDSIPESPEHYRWAESLQAAM
ncbi:MAG: hypothetical protein HQ518_31165 [Rhodopirellula sp.]|nr:hypothetical protein [Rhodopirellula sp.]